jgi:hypothetical protein
LSAAGLVSVTDTIPDNVFDELFGKPDVRPPDKEVG